MTKKLLCNPPAVRVAEAGDPEVCGMFEGAGTALLSLVERLEEYTPPAGGPNYAKILKDFERSVVVLEAGYVTARKALAAETVAQMHKVHAVLMSALGEEPYGGG